METRKSDVLVIGSGGAGVMAAVEAARAGARVTLVSKDPIGYGDTRISLGVMSTSPDTRIGDNEEAFVEDMLRGGDGLNDPKLVGALVGDALEATIAFERCGHIFSRDEYGELRRMSIPPGGHSASRAIASPMVGISMGHTMRSAAARAGVEALEEAICAELLVEDGDAVGAAALRVTSGEPIALFAKTTILAAGGAGSLYYPHTDCMPSVSGDSYGLALRAGAELVDMEQVQFLPFGLSHPPAMVGAPCGEPAMAGPHGELRNASGEIVLEDIMPRTRAEVARVMMEEIQRGGATQHGGLLLDHRPNLRAPGGASLLALMQKAAGPFLDIVRRAYGKRAADLEEPWDVLPTAHYVMGGVKTDAWCRSRVPALYACGQAQGGVMGGNRLGSTSLTEIFVFGKRAGRAAAREAAGRELADERTAREPLDRLASLFGSTGSKRPIELKRGLQSLMWERVGPLRNHTGLGEALAEIASTRKRAQDLRISGTRPWNTEAVDAIELSHMLASAEAIAASAIERRESRGAHVRSEFPERDDERPVRNMIVEMRDGSCEVRSEEAGS
jgi:succinate dehydrogenase/fumarate reductase flavoprotein subunit